MSKSKRFSVFSSFVKGLFRGKRKEAVAMETYLSSIGSIQKLIDTRKVGINLKERHVMLDSSIHALFFKDERRYIAFFDKLRAFMNFQLGRMQKKDFVEPGSRVTFEVVFPHYTYVDREGNPVPVHQQLRYETILVGVCEDGRLDYRAVEIKN